MPLEIKARVITHRLATTTELTFIKESVKLVIQLDVEQLGALANVLGDVGVTVARAETARRANMRARLRP